MIQRIKSEIYCGTLEACTRNFNDRLEDDLPITLYKVELSKYQDLVASLSEFLTPNELKRSNGYYFLKDKNRFIICRTLLKFLLTEQTGLVVSEIYLENLNNKKPYLPSHPSVFFNVSYGGKYALIAIGKDILGVDIEEVKKDYDFMESLPHIFSKEEIDIVLKADNKAYVFYKFWTRKEAIVKVSGKGIDDNLPKIPARDGTHSVNPTLVENINNLQVLSFDIDQHHIGTVAFTGNKPELRMLPLYTVSTSIERLKDLYKFKKL